MDINHESEWEMTTTEELNDPKTSCTKKYLWAALLVWSSILVTGAIFYLDSSKVTQNASCPGRHGCEEQGNPEEQDNYPDEQVNYVEETENYPGKAMQCCKQSTDIRPSGFSYQRKNHPKRWCTSMFRTKTDMKTSAVLQQATQGPNMQTTQHSCLAWNWNIWFYDSFCY